MSPPLPIHERVGPRDSGWPDGHRYELSSITKSGSLIASSMFGGFGPFRRRMADSRALPIAASLILARHAAALLPSHLEPLAGWPTSRHFIGKRPSLSSILRGVDGASANDS
ncbi:hypothetical protein G7046_g1543 [Stylonectria norvegica]|nr:hypothetical protein G7046_g1543 [Stylonectria norvegica]